MFLTAIALSVAGGFVAGSIYGKVVLADASKLGAEIKSHISSEIATVKTAVTVEIASLRSKI